MLPSKISGLTVKEIADKANAIVDTLTKGSVNVTTATKALTVDDNGITLNLKKADGIAVTLPACQVGLKYKVLVGTSVTSNALTVATSAATELFVGGPVTGLASGGATAFLFAADESNDDTFSMNGTTTGGLLGTTLTFECISSTRWLVSGVNIGSGSLATSFS
jgi:hypothetical protein